MKTLLCLLAMLVATTAHAYGAKELHEDCLAAEEFYNQKKAADLYQSVKVARCVSYLAGFADSYAISDYLGDKVGLKLNAYCLPNDSDLSYRLVRSVLAHLDHQPPNTTASPAMLVAGALAKTFPCSGPDSLESKK